MDKIKESVQLPLVVGDSFKGSDTDDKYVTMQYTFRPSSTINREGSVTISDSREVEILFHPNSPSSASSSGAASGTLDSLVTLRGSAMQHASGTGGDNYVDCVLILETHPQSSSSSMSASRSRGSSSAALSAGDDEHQVDAEDDDYDLFADDNDDEDDINGQHQFRLEVVSTTILGLNHVRDEASFRYEDSSLEKMVRANKMLKSKKKRTKSTVSTVAGTNKSKKTDSAAVVGEEEVSDEGAAAGGRDGKAGQAVPTGATASASAAATDTAPGPEPKGKRARKGESKEPKGAKKDRAMAAVKAILSKSATTQEK